MPGSLEGRIVLVTGAGHGIGAAVARACAAEGATLVLTSKSRAALALLHAAGLQPEVVEYLRTPPTVAELDQLCRKLGMEPQAIIRFDDDSARSLGLKPDDSRSRQCASSARRSGGSAGSRGWMIAWTVLPQSASGKPITATSPTAECSVSAASTSAG